MGTAYLPESCRGSGAGGLNAGATAGLSDPDGSTGGQGNDLDVAMRRAVVNALDFLQHDLGLDRAIAYAYLSAAADFSVSQVADRTTGVHDHPQGRLLRSPPPRPKVACVTSSPDIHAVIDARAVTAVFQPLVDIASGGLIGYEALGRGPAGTALEAPMELFAAARAVGREAELDWVCRAVAFRTALEAGLDRTITLFVNVEPVALRTPCPPDLAGVVDQARTRLRVVTEMTERAIAADPSALLAATAGSRAAGWGVALDDVGADPLSLALMPFVHPDVVKLDMGLLHNPQDPRTAQVVSAVLAYAEASGAVILAEGVETAEHLQVARTMGATVGQGWYYGRPGPLPACLPPTGPQLRLLSLNGDSQAGTPFSIVAGARPVTRTSKELLMPISRYLEAQAGEGSQPPVLLACFQDSQHFTKRTAQRFTLIAAHSPLVAAFGAGLDEEPVPGVRGAHLEAGDPLAGEWNVIVVGPHYAAALVARDLGDTGPDADRRFDYVVTHDRQLVVAAARSLLQWLTPAPSLVAALIQ